MAKFSFEIDVKGAECSRFAPQFTYYGTIVCEGDNLEELIDSATVDICDQDGGEVAIVAADSWWMLKKIEERYHAKLATQAEQEFERRQVADALNAQNGWH